MLGDTASRVYATRQHPSRRNPPSLEGLPRSRSDLFGLAQRKRGLAWLTQPSSATASSPSTPTSSCWCHCREGPSLRKPRPHSTANSSRTEPLGPDRQHASRHRRQRRPQRRAPRPRRRALSATAFEPKHRQDSRMGWISNRVAVISICWRPTDRSQVESMKDAVHPSVTGFSSPLHMSISASAHAMARTRNARHHL